MKRPRIRIPLMCIVFSVICVRHASSEDAKIFLAQSGNRLQVCEQRRSYCEVDDIHGVITIHRFDSEGPASPGWQVSVPGVFRHYVTNELIDYAYIITSEGLFSCTRAGKDEVVVALKVELGPDFDVNFLQIMAVANKTALLLYQDIFKLVSPTGMKVLHQISKPYRAQATSKSRVMLLAPGEDCDLQMLIVFDDLSKTFRGTRITTYGQGGVYPILRLIAASADARSYAGVVTYRNSPGDIQGDALMYWRYDSVLDIDRSEEFAKCNSIAVYEDTICALFPSVSPSGNMTARIASWKVSMARGLIPLEQTFINIGEPDSNLCLLPETPAVCSVSRDKNTLTYSRFQVVHNKEVGTDQPTPPKNE